MFDSDPDDSDGDSTFLTLTGSYAITGMDDFCALGDFSLSFPLNSLKGLSQLNCGLAFPTPSKRGSARRSLEFSGLEQLFDGSIERRRVRHAVPSEAFASMATTTRRYLSLALEGDFNADGAIDAADYVVWRRQLGVYGESHRGWKR